MDGSEKAIQLIVCLSTTVSMLVFEGKSSKYHALYGSSKWENCYLENVMKMCVHISLFYLILLILSCYYLRYADLALGQPSI